jgi:hypothetical protein
MNEKTQQLIRDLMDLDNTARVMVSMPFARLVSENPRVQELGSTHYLPGGVKVGHVFCTITWPEADDTLDGHLRGWCWHTLQLLTFPLRKLRSLIQQQSHETH